MPQRPNEHPLRQVFRIVRVAGSVEYIVINPFYIAFVEDAKGFAITLNCLRQDLLIVYYLHARPLQSGFLRAEASCQ